MTSKTKFVIGIDLGTRYCSVAIYKDDEFQVTPNHTGHTRIAYDDSLKYRILTAQNGGIPISNILQIIGIKYDYLLSKNIIKSIPFTIIDDGENRPIIQIGNINNNTFYPQEILSIIISHLKALTESYINEQIKDYVITVPVASRDSTRREIIAAANIAGLNVLRLINYPSAAIIASGYSSIQIQSSTLW